MEEDYIHISFENRDQWADVVDFICKFTSFTCTEAFLTDWRAGVRGYEKIRYVRMLALSTDPKSMSGIEVSSATFKLDMLASFPRRSF